jgi:hypothetical protein
MNRREFVVGVGAAVVAVAAPASAESAVFLDSRARPLLLPITIRDLPCETQIFIYGAHDVDDGT